MSLQTIGVDAICQITQYLTRNDLRPFTQLNRLCAQLLQQRHQAYYRLPLPSFQRQEFNLNTYRKWLINRQFLVITSPEQLVQYSPSRIMTHATDIELRLDDYCQLPVDPLLRVPQTVQPAGWFENPMAHLDAALTQCLIDMRSNIARFEHVRSLRLWYRPTLINTLWNNRCSSAPVNQLTFQNWFLHIAHLCVTIWAPKLVSFELEVHPYYRWMELCDGVLENLPLLTSVQHLGIFFPRSVFRVPKFVPDLLSTFQFPSSDHAVLIFQGTHPKPPPIGATHRAGYSYTAADTDGPDKLTYKIGDYFTFVSKVDYEWWRFTHHQSEQQGLVRWNWLKKLTVEEQSVATDSMTSATDSTSTELKWTNASRCIWLTEIGFRNIFQFLNDTQQLLTNESTGPYRKGGNNKNERPIMHIQRQRLCNFLIDADKWTYQQSQMHARDDLMNHQLKLLVNNFTAATPGPGLRTHSNPSHLDSSLESFTLIDQFGSFELVREYFVPSPPVVYPLYLPSLRTRLRTLLFDVSTEPVAWTRASANHPDGVFRCKCNGCGKKPIRDQRWKCAICTKFNLCQQCHLTMKETIGDHHTPDHPMTQSFHKYRTVPTAPPLSFLGVTKDSEVFTCEGCGVSLIRGQCWKCTICDDFEFCQECRLSMKEVDDHHSDHLMTPVHHDKVHSNRTPSDLSGTTSLAVRESAHEVAESHVWPRLECLTLRNRPWETILFEAEIERPHPSLTQQTWLALEQSLPALESLGLSIGFIPFDGRPLSGVLLRIKHLSLFDNNTCHIVNSTRPGFIAYLTSCLTTITVQLRQLESFRLSLMDESAEDKKDRIWTNLPFNECLAPLILSSNNLRHLIIDAPNFKPSHSQFEVFESVYQNQLFQLYGLWKLFQPSFEPPLDCNSIRRLLYPLLAPEAQPLYDVAFVEEAARYQENTSKPTNPTTAAPISQLTTTISSSVNGFVSSYVNGWKSQLNEWLMTPSEADRAREIKRLQSIHDRANLFERICTSLNSRRNELFQQHPHLTFQRRTFRITMETHLIPTNSTRLWK